MGMGRHILRRKALTFAAAALLIVPPRPAAGESLIFPEESAGVLIEAPEKVPPPWFHPDRRHTSRSVPPAAADAPVGSRQFHGGPEVFSPEFVHNDRVEYFLKRLARSATERGWILDALERGRPYAHFIRGRIEEHGLPPEIFYLPVVESLYKINAHSRTGALGLWQFMPGSIGNWMRIDEWADERKDFWKSTIAAMEKLEQNRRATGSWLLALAAYNCGLGRVQRVVRQSGIDDFWELSRRGLLPRETRDYVPKFIAVARFASGLGRRGMDPDWETPARWERLRLSQSVDLRLLAEAAGIPYEDLRLGNAELRYGITPPPDRAYHLKVPSEHARRVSEALARADGKLLRFAIHTIAAGHTLSEIGAHYGIPVSMITRYNPGLRAEYLRIGAKLVVPMYRDVGPFVKKAAASAEEDPGPVSFENEYVVRSGDSLWGIARSFGTTPVRLARANGLDENGIIRIGMTLKVP